MASYNKFQIFVQDIANKVHNFNSDQLTVALTNSSNAPVATNSVLADLTEIAYTNLSSRNVTTTSSIEVAGTYNLKVSNLTLNASGGAVAPFRYLTIYNSTAASKNLICWFDYGADITLNSGDNLTISFDAINGLFSIT